MTKDALIWGILFPAISYPFFQEAFHPPTSLYRNTFSNQLTPYYYYRALREQNLMSIRKHLSFLFSSFFHKKD